MLKRFFSRENKFFELMIQSAELSRQAATTLSDMLCHLDKAEEYSKKMKDLEHQADEITHQTIGLLHKTFLTPIDREDIHKLITELDDILDFLEAAAERICLYQISQITQEAKEMSDVCVLSTEHVKKAVEGLKNLKSPEYIIQQCVEINRLENIADNLLRKGIAELFTHEKDIRHLIQLKEIYEILENVTDRCEDVANLLEGIVLEYS